jgi:hypothetical protein
MKEPMVTVVEDLLPFHAHGDACGGVVGNATEIDDSLP